MLDSLKGMILSAASNAPMASAPAIRQRVIVAVMLLAFAVFPYLASVTDNPFMVRLVTRIMIFAIAAVALDLVVGFGGLVTLCHASVIGLGSYVVAIFSWHAANQEALLGGLIAGTDNALLVWPIAILICAAVSFMLGFLALRTKGVYFIMITLAFNQMLYFVFVGWRKYGGLDGLDLALQSKLPLIDLGNRYALYYLVFALMTATVFVSWRLVNSRFGVVLRGSQQNERRMNAIGYRTFWYKLAIFTISGALAGLAGVLLANANQYISPAEMSWTRSAELLAMLIFGGVGTLIGPILGTSIYLGLHFFLSNYTEHWEATFGLILMAMVLFGRGGIYNFLARTKGAAHE
jgi:branched-chain amino acid transport system permease protein